MKQGLLLWSPSHHTFLPPSLPLTFLSISRTKSASAPFKAALDSIDSQQQQQLTARERRKMRNERRGDKAGYSWREEVEEKLINKPKKKPLRVSEKLNLDNLAELGPQWWIVRVSQGKEDLTGDILGRVLSRDFPNIHFKIYVPAVEERRKLKNGTYSIKERPLFPKCVYLWCELNKEIHDYIREIDGVWGFLGFKVGYRRRQINRPSPVSNEDMQAIFQQEKKEQERYDQALEEEEQNLQKKEEEEQETVEFVNLGSEDVTNSVPDSKPKGRSQKVGANGSSKTKPKKLTAGSTVRVISGNFAEFTGSLKKLSRKTGKATVGFTLFGKETLVDLDVNEIVAE